jgi:DNA-binding transcriptional MerR regulator
VSAAQSIRDPADTAELLTIGELAQRTGMPTSALRYYDELALVTPTTRTSGHRRYAASAVAEVGVIVFLREVGFSLNEIGRFLSADEDHSRQQLIERKLSELTEQRHRLDVARTVLEHGQRCPAGDPMDCPRFWSIIDGHLHGLSLEDSHAQLHSRASRFSPDSPTQPENDKSPN